MKQDTRYRFEPPDIFLGAYEGSEIGIRSAEFVQALSRDQTAVMAAIQGAERWWKLSSPGRNYVESDGSR